MAEITLQADTGRTTGTRESRRLRAAGRVPATVYGLGRDAQTVSVVWRDLRTVLTTDAGLNVLVDLAVDGADTDLVMVKDLQRHPIRRDVLHVDFLRVSRDVVITVDVPVVLEGEAEAVLRAGGMVDPVLNSLTVNAKPGSIPNEIIIDVSALTIGDSIRVGDLKLPAGVTTDLDPEEAVVVASAGMGGEDAGAEGEATEAAEGEAAGGEAADGDAAAEGGEDAGEAGSDEG